jgi:uncharacterized glyoxalase superfamily protein PhnB
MSSYKPDGYNAVSPYFVVDGAQEFVDLMVAIFDARVLRRYERPDGKIMHIELQIDDSVIMIADSTEQFPANKLLVHVYLPDVDKTFDKAVELGCEPIDKPRVRADDPDKRGAFKDIAGNLWSVATQAE